MEKNAAAAGGRTPASVPMMPTPPPSALNLSSPKLGHLSPVNTNHNNTLNEGRASVVVNTNFTLPPTSYAEDDQRNIDRFQSGGSFPLSLSLPYHSIQFSLFVKYIQLNLI